MIDRYDWRGGSEALLRIGRESPITLLIIPALFEEANRMRHFTVSLMRGLADRGMGSVLPDLPGTSESSADFRDVTLEDWSDALETVGRLVGPKVLTIGIRGGCLLDGLAHRGWRLAPETGDRLLRDLVRATAFSTNQTTSELSCRARSAPTRLAGYDFTPQFFNAIAASVPRDGDYRIARLEDEASERDVTFSGKKLWRAAEPGDDPTLVASALEDIVSWADSCANI